MHYSSDWLRIASTCLFAVTLPGTFLFSRSFTKGVILCLVCFSCLLVWWQSLKPTNNKVWAADVAQISHGEIKDNKLTMHNVRSFHYIADKEDNEQWQTVENWTTRVYPLDTFQGLDLFLSYWGSEHIAHIIMSWDFGDDQHLAISIETRKDTRQEYSAIKGFFKQFELSYVAADEKDIIRLRTNFRKERVYVYRLEVPKVAALALLENYLIEMNKLVTIPEFYNALTRNCITSVRLHRNAIAPDDPIPMNWQLIASGHIDELLYDKGLLMRDLPFDELRQQSRIDLRMQGRAGQDFSRVFRDGLPK